MSRIMNVSAQSFCINNKKNALITPYSFVVYQILTQKIPLHPFLFRPEIFSLHIHSQLNYKQICLRRSMKKIKFVFQLLIRHKITHFLRSFLNLKIVLIFNIMLHFTFIGQECLKKSHI